MMSTILVSVTADDIANGIRTLCAECPIALAVRRQLPNAEVTTVAVYCDGNRNNKNVLLPAIARDFIEAFDDGEPVQPIEFELGVTE